ncbi:alpha-amylase family glycosyl hydrolase [Spirochaeta africana]|uniref:Alpha-amylase n=1 Tax=Spirochaeta africana (strain ATCC 700263 / DSM 8902 / Z-7692) TaxID=889378 RepID=H9UHT4_SPIAZ|nr:alpha-amylase family glycosyl hydrolase [Spirochaeta africana]AFG37077.1 glycosidase [Spirochaeta africana DSM 8902]
MKLLSGKIPGAAGAALFIVMLLAGCANRPHQFAAPAIRAARPQADQSQGHESWTYNLAIYEVNIRQYTEEGTFAAFAEHLDRLEELGVGILWLMPIHPIGEEERKGSLGSYYAVQDFAAVNPEFGSKEDFRQLVDDIHARGIRVILDWVPNHTAWDNVLTETNPEWYATDAEGNFIIPPGTNWTDVIQLDHAQEGLRDYMIEVMSYWVEEYGVDGFRFDAVNHVPATFLIETNNALKERFPEIFLLAEADGPRWHHYGYSMSFAWNLYGFERGLLMQIAAGNADARDAAAFFAQEREVYEDDYRMYFTDNHDENSWHGTTRQRFGDAEEVFAVLTQLAPGMPLIYSGQEVGLDHQLEFFEKDEIPWQEHPYTEMYTALVQLKRRNQALWNGRFGGRIQPFAAGSDRVFGFTREQSDDAVLAVLNLSGASATAELDHGLAGDWQLVYAGSTELSADELASPPASIALGPWGYAVYERIR